MGDAVRPLFATPCYGGLVTWQYATAMVDLAQAFQAAGVPFRTYMLGGDSLVDRARNDCVAEFLESDCTHLFFVDSDIAFAPQDAFDTLTAGLDFVLGSYRKKTETEKWTTVLLVDEGEAALRLHPGSRAIRYVECAEGGAGFLCLSRAAVDQLVAGVESYEGERNGRPRRCPDLFRSVVDGGVRIGEDQYVCRRWRALGGTVWCAVDVRLAHVGTGGVFEGDYAGHIRLRTPGGP
jgi:hypothetical protein